MVCTSVAVVDGRQLPLASWYAAGRADAWWMRLNAEALLADGSCWRDARLRRVGESAQAWPAFTPAAPDGTLPQVPGWQLGAPRTSLDMLNTLVLGPDASEGTDPSVTTSVAEEYPKFDLPEAVIPDDLKNFAAPPMLDLRHVPFMSEIAPRADVFFAYDPICHRVVFGCKDRDVFDRIEQFLACRDDFARNFEYETWLFDAAVPKAPWSKTSITARGGQKSVIEWRGRKRRPFITLETELTDNNVDIEVRYDFRCRMKAQADTGIDWHGNSTTHLARGVPLLTDALKLPDGRTIRQGQRAGVSQVRAE